MKSLEGRIEELEDLYPGVQERDVVICADGSRWMIPATETVMSWIWSHGRVTADGRQIVDLVMPDYYYDKTADALSKAIAETEGEICRGVQEWPISLDAQE